MPHYAGEIAVIERGEWRAGVSDIGATLRFLRHNGSDVTWSLGDGEMSRGGCGQVLAPWPNRLAGGSYEFDAIRAAAPINDASTNSAIHGLVRWQRFELVEHGRDQVCFRLELPPEPAYPFCLELEIDYLLDTDGLVVTTTAWNVDERALPFALGFHPYLLAGEKGVDGARLELPAGRRLIADARQIPLAERGLLVSEHAAVADLRLDGTRLDDCFTDLDELNGRWQARFYPDATAERYVELWAEHAFGYVMCFTGDTLASGDARRALAIEPMTSPPNAFASGVGLIVLEPGESFSASWGIAIGE